MTEQKAKPAAKKSTSSKTTSKTKTSASPAAKKSVAKKPVAKKTATPPAKKKATGVTSSLKKTASSKVKLAPNKGAQNPTPEERYRMVEVTAYFIAEKNGFQGDATEHWAAAEKEVNRILGQ